MPTRLHPGAHIFLAEDLRLHRSYGSVGMPVTDVVSGDPLVLTAAHVVGSLARGWQEMADVYSTDGFPPIPSDRSRVGNTVRTVPQQVAGTCGVDAAVFRLHGNATCNRDTGRGALSHDHRDLTDTDIDVSVYKRGCTTGLTRGRFYEIATDVSLKVRSDLTVTYERVLTVFPEAGAPFSQPGDSGAIVFDEDLRAVGLVVGMEDPRKTTQPLTFCIPMGAVLAELGVVA